MGLSSRLVPRVSSRGRHTDAALEGLPFDEPVVELEPDPELLLFMASNTDMQ
jgi:hypothetical protein